MSSSRDANPATAAAFGRGIGAVRRIFTTTNIRRAIEGDDIYADVVTLALAYAFILFAAWNDQLLGLAPNAATFLAQWLLAFGLACEIALRLIFVRKRPWYFYPLVVVDAISVATVIPGLTYVTFARIARLIMSGARMLHLIDAISMKRSNPYLVLLVYPFVVPIAAAFFYAIESHAANSEVHDYFHSLALMLSYSLTVGLVTDHPVTLPGKMISGVMFLAGLMCVSIVGNTLHARYSRTRD
jgi:hypothetical protein